MIRKHFSCRVYLYGNLFATLSQLTHERVVLHLFGKSGMIIQFVVKKPNQFFTIDVILYLQNELRVWFVFFIDHRNIKKKALEKFREAI